MTNRTPWRSVRQSPSDPTNLVDTSAIPSAELLPDDVLALWQPLSDDDMTWRTGRMVTEMLPQTPIVAVQGDEHTWVLLWSVLHLPHVANLRLDGKPILISVCDIRSTGMAFAADNAAIDFLVRQRTGQATWILSHSPNHMAEAVSKLLRAQEILGQGGMIFIAGDGGQGTGGIEMPIRGFPWFFRTGAAELALDTHAILLPVISTLELSGHVRVSFFDPLLSNAKTRQAQVEDLTRQFAILVDQQWTELLGSMKWRKLQAILDCSISRNQLTLPPEDDGEPE